MTVVVAHLLTLPSDETHAPAADGLACRESPEVARLVEAARGGDAAAFGQLIAMHERAVFRAAMAALGAHAEAQDAAQDAFVMAWRRLPTFRGESQFRTWLLTITWRKALDRRRRLAMWHRRTSGSVTGRSGSVAGRSGLWSGHPDAFTNVPEPSADPEARAITSDAADRVRREIAKLSPKLRDTLLLAASGEHSYEEIGAMLGVPLGTVKWRVAEARRVLTLRCEGRS